MGPPMPEPPAGLTGWTLRDPQRAANDTIRGYLEQAHWTVLRWVDLDESEVLVCEGNEDIDRFLIDEQGRVVRVTEEQIKALSDRVSARSAPVYESIFNFLLAFRYYAQRDEQAYFVFTSSAGRAAQHTAETSGANSGGAAADLSIDVLRTWMELARIGNEDARKDRVAALRTGIRQILERYRPGGPGVDDAKAARRRGQDIEAAIAYLDGPPERWAAFLDSVQWSLGEATGAALESRILDKLAADPRCRDLPGRALMARLVHTVLTTSSQRAPEARALTAACLGRLCCTSRAELEAWVNEYRAMELLDLRPRLELLEQQVQAHDGRLRHLETDDGGVAGAHDFATYIGSIRSPFAGPSMDDIRAGRLWRDEAHISRAASLLDTPPHRVLLWGPAACGKTALARQIAVAACEHGAQPLLFDLDVERQLPARAAEIVRSAGRHARVGDRVPMLVIENAHRAPDEIAPLVRPAQAGGVRLLVTSRQEHRDVLPDVAIRLDGKDLTRRAGEILTWYLRDWRRLSDAEQLRARRSVRWDAYGHDLWLFWLSLQAFDWERYTLPFMAPIAELRRRLLLVVPSLPPYWDDCLYMVAGLGRYGIGTDLDAAARALGTDLAVLAAAARRLADAGILRIESERRMASCWHTTLAQLYWQLLQTERQRWGVNARRAMAGSQP